MENTKQSSAQKFVETLLNEGANVNCDDTCDSFNDQLQLPPFYDEELYKRGQKFFYKHMFALFFAKCLGLIAVLSVPNILKILIYTKQSGNNLTAYRRYMATIFHMMVWYDSDFKPGSQLWKSIADVRNRHNSASSRGCSAKLNRISQKDMALTQFGFMGLAIARSEMVGVHSATEEEWKSFLHVWRVIGYLMGIEDRFNLCDGTVEDTKEICNILAEKCFLPNIEKKDSDFLAMSSYMIDGLWCINPALNFERFMCYLHITLQPHRIRTVTPTYFQLNSISTVHFKYLVYVVSLLRYNWLRLYENFTTIASLWLMKNFPFLAYYQFGIGNSHVYILQENKFD